MTNISTGEQLYTFMTHLNGDVPLDQDLASTLISTAKAVIEEERPWCVLRKTNTSLTVASSDTWQTAKSLSGITDFSAFYGDSPIKLFDGNNRVQYYRQVPWERRLEFKDVSYTFVHDQNSGNIYFNGTPPYAGTLYIDYISTQAEIDVTSSSAVWTLFPARFLPVLGFYAVGIYKGAVDYDSITKNMLPEHRSTLMALKSAMIAWDDKRQDAIISQNDPTEDYGGNGFSRPTVYYNNNG